MPPRKTHLTPDGRLLACKARVRPCKFKEAPHFSSQEEGEAYLKAHYSEVPSGLRKSSTDQEGQSGGVLPAKLGEPFPEAYRKRLQEEAAALVAAQCTPDGGYRPVQGWKPHEPYGSTLEPPLPDYAYLGMGANRTAYLSPDRELVYKLPNNFLMGLVKDPATGKRTVPLEMDADSVKDVSLMMKSEQYHYADYSPEKVRAAGAEVAPTYFLEVTTPNGTKVPVVAQPYLETVGPDAPYEALADDSISRQKEKELHEAGLVDLTPKNLARRKSDGVYVAFDCLDSYRFLK